MSNPGTGPRRPQPKSLRWQGNRTADYRVCPTMPSYNLRENVKYDMNWGRSQLTPWGIIVYPHGPVDAVVQPDTPAVPLAVKRPSNYVYMPYDTVTPSSVRAYDTSRRMY